MLISLLTFALAAAPLDVAQGHLKAGRLDDVLFALDGQTFTGDDKPKAATLLGEAARAAVKKKDDLLALQFAQMALKLEPRQPAALEAAARTSWSQQQFQTAEQYADTWVSVEPTNAAARLLRAQLAAEAAEWQLALEQLGQAKFTGADGATASALKAKATKQLSEKRASQTAVAALEKQMAEVARQRGSNRGQPQPAFASTGVVIYTTDWCGYCKAAKKFLKKKGVDFVERDIEKDPDAAQELAQKAAAAGVQPSGVPVIDVRGKLLLGYDEQTLANAL